MSDRNGGYTRLIKLNNRKNDNAPVTLIEFVDIAKDIVETDLQSNDDKKKGEENK